MAEKEFEFLVRVFEHGTDKQVASEKRTAPGTIDPECEWCAKLEAEDKIETDMVEEWGDHDYYWEFTLLDVC